MSKKYILEILCQNKIETFSLFWEQWVKLSDHTLNVDFEQLLLNIVYIYMNICSIMASEV